MTLYTIKLSGCDDSTSFPVELTSTEAALVERVAALSREASEFGCQPTMTVRQGVPDEESQ